MEIKTMGSQCSFTILYAHILKVMYMSVMKMSIYTVKTNPSDCPPREKQAALCILAATCWAIDTHTALEKNPTRIMVLCEKDGINAEREGKEEILWGKKYLHLQKSKILSFHRW